MPLAALTERKREVLEGGWQHAAKQQRLFRDRMLKAEARGMKRLSLQARQRLACREREQCRFRLETRSAFQ